MEKYLSEKYDIGHSEEIKIVKRNKIKIGFKRIGKKGIYRRQAIT